MRIRYGGRKLGNIVREHCEYDGKTSNKKEPKKLARLSRCQLQVDLVN